MPNAIPDSLAIKGVERKILYLSSKSYKIGQMAMNTYGTKRKQLDDNFCDTN